jgi:hypothetical protein
MMLNDRGALRPSGTFRPPRRLSSTADARPCITRHQDCWLPLRPYTFVCISTKIMSQAVNPPTTNTSSPPADWEDCTPCRVVGKPSLLKKPTFIRPSHMLTHLQAVRHSSALVLSHTSLATHNYDMQRHRYEPVKASSA